jgi:hypothetical protein
MSAVLRLTALWLALPGVAAPEEPPAQGFTAQIAGDWQGGGEVSGMAAEMSMRWEPVLGGQFLRLSLENRMSGKDGRPRRFQAQAYYRVGGDGAVSGRWFDSRGISLPLQGRVDGDAMTIDWGDEASVERGRSRYRLSADALEVTDEVIKDGVLAVFGRTRLTRQREAPETGS